MIVHKKVYKDFVAGFVERTKKLRVGNGLESKTEWGPVVSEKQKESILKWLAVGRKEGAQLLCGGNALEKGSYQHGHFIQATIFADVDPHMQIAQEEIFGPVVSVIPCSSFQGAIEIGNSVRYGLSAAMYTQDLNQAFVAMREMNTGSFYVNAPPIGAEIHLPFGGTKETGNGHREAAEAALDVFSEWKAIYLDFSGHPQRAQIV